MENYKIRAGLSIFDSGSCKDLFASGENAHIFSGKLSRQMISPETEKLESMFHSFRENKGRFFIDIEFDSYEDDWFIFMPSACYDGNKFTLLQCPPMQLFILDHMPENPLDPPVTMLEVPSVNNGFNRMITDFSAPVIGIWKKKEKEAYFLAFEQYTSAGDHGVEMFVSKEKTLVIRLSIPCLRNKEFVMCKNLDLPALFPAGKEIRSDFFLHRFSVADFAAFYKNFAMIRNIFPEQKAYKNTRSFSHSLEILMHYFETGRWNEKWGFYGKSINNNKRVELGWVSFVELPALLAQGTAETLQRVKRHLARVFENAQLPSGLFYPAMLERNGQISYEHSFRDRSMPYSRIWGYMRHQCETLLTCLKCLMCLEAKGEKIPKNWKKSLEKLAEAIQGIWEKYGQLGFMADLETCEILIGSSDNGCTAPGALMISAQYFGREDFFRSAAAMGKYYSQRLLQYGFTCGGPGDALLAPDSESAFAMLESFVLLYEGTKEESWLSMAEYSADYCSSWTPAVAWKFPEKTLFDRLDIDCRGAVQANLQNQHGAPGACTLSASALMRLYCYTGEERFISLLQEIAHNCVQYISTKAHPFCSSISGRKLEEGAVCEKVYFQDYTLQRGDNPSVDGGWPASSLLLTLVENPGLFWDVEKEKIFILDHVEAQVSGNILTVKNPLTYSVTIKCKVLTEKEKLPELVSGLFPYRDYKSITLASGEEKQFSAEELI